MAQILCVMMATGTRVSTISFDRMASDASTKSTACMSQEMGRMDRISTEGGSVCPGLFPSVLAGNALRLSALVEELALPASSTRLVRMPSDMMTGQSEALHNAVRENT